MTPMGAPHKNAYVLIYDMGQVPYMIIGIYANPIQKRAYSRMHRQRNDLYNEGMIASRFYCEWCAAHPLQQSDQYNEGFGMAQELRYKGTRLCTPTYYMGACPM